jgi:hypothetical protein
MFVLNLVFLHYIWETLKKVYTLNRWQRMGLFAIPVVSLLLFVVAIAIYATQMAMVMQ